ncbi:hypothetical protein CKO15_11815 [Halorhodospira abdelmalekii]|uniref:type II secretion system protein GspM n=1 Tax=Halorhodospira abdelmalekii TaxID=421629 RepID=UPI0019083BD2|nr:type II secretion system protein GspM [Halorhodospira abdelmalekii]MBK1735951.1 hypothetical protein [Halorhodospira abdelmalekii]
MTAAWERVRAAIEERSTRERVLLLAAAGVLCGAAAYFGAIESSLERGAAAEAEIGELQQQIATAKIRRAEIEEQLAIDPDERLRREIDRLEEALAEIEAHIAGEMPDFIAPHEMRAVLRGVLDEHSGIRWVHLQRLPAEPLLEADADGEVPPIFRHPVHLEVEASYMDTLRFLEALEALPWQLAWDRMEYTVAEHPQARVTVRLYTISGQRSWLGL